MTAVRPDVIDAHQHFWRYTPERYDWIDDSMAALRRDFLPADAHREMAAASIDGCIAVQARQDAAESEWLLELADRHPFIFGVIGWVDLQADAVERQIERLAAHPRFVGVRHVVQAEPDDRFLLRPAFCRGISRLAAFGLSYDLLLYPRHLEVAAEFVSRFERQSFVLDHLAKPQIRLSEMREWEKGLRALAAHPNVVCKVSGLATEADWRGWTADALRPYLDVAVDAFGVERLMAGSDWPVCTVAGTYGEVMSVFDDYFSGISAHARDAVFGGNAARVWRLPAGARA